MARFLLHDRLARSPSVSDEELRALLAPPPHGCGADPDACDDYARSAFEVALQHSNDATLRRVVRVTTRLSLCAADAVLRSGRITTVFGSFKDAGFERGTAPIQGGRAWTHVAAECTPPDDMTQLLRVLANEGSDLHARDAKGRTPLHLLARRAEVPQDAVKLLIADVAALDTKGRSPMDKASFAGAQMLLRVALGM